MTLTFIDGDMTVTKLLSNEASCLDLLLAACDIVACSFTTDELMEALAKVPGVLTNSR